MAIAVKKSSLAAAVSRLRRYVGEPIPALKESWLAANSPPVAFV